jgi:hypothetical protein
MLSPGSGGGKDRRFSGLKDLFNHLNAVGSRYAYGMAPHNLSSVTTWWPVMQVQLRQGCSRKQKVE